MGASDARVIAEIEDGTTPTWVAVADLNRDGNPDLAVTDTSDNSVHVLLGVGDGTFGPASTFMTAAGPLSIAAADFNGDGKLDLATASTGSGAGTVSILLGNGSGGFGIGQTTALSGTGGIKMMTTGDVNVDGKIDVVLAAGSNGTGAGALVLLGNGNGTFATPALYSGGAFDSSWVEIADLTGDGKADLAALSRSSYVVSILTGNGFGNFAKLQSYSTSVRPLTAAVGDFDFDGRADLVIGGENGGGLPGSASVHLQSGCLP